MTTTTRKYRETQEARQQKNGDGPKQKTKPLGVSGCEFDSDGRSPTGWQDKALAPAIDLDRLQDMAICRTSNPASVESLIERENSWVAGRNTPGSGART